MQSVTGDNFKPKLEMPSELLQFESWTSVTFEGEPNLKSDHTRWLVIDGLKPVRQPIKKVKNVS